MGGGSTQIRDKRLKRVLLEQYHICRTEIMRDQNAIGGFRVRRKTRGGLSHECLEQTFADLPDIIAALTQVGIFHLLELGDEQIQLLFQGPFGITTLLLDALFGDTCQHVVFQDQAVQFQESRHLCGGSGGDLVLQFLEFEADLQNGLIKTL